MTKFTKGPWLIANEQNISEDDLEYLDNIWMSGDMSAFDIYSGEVLIAQAVQCRPFPEDTLQMSDEEQTANAHLISSAPELYKALHELDPDHWVLKKARGEEDGQE